VECVSLHGNFWIRTKIFSAWCLCIIWLLVTRVPPTIVNVVDSYMSLTSDLSEQYTDIKIHHRIINLFSVLREKCDCKNIVGTKLANSCLLFWWWIRFKWPVIKQYELGFGVY
jgi:hypothetical protein